MKDPEKIRTWKFLMTDQDDVEFYYPDFDCVFEGNWKEAKLRGDELSDEAEDELECWVLKVTIESV